MDNSSSSDQRRPPSGWL